MTDIVTIPSSRRLADGDTLLIDPPETRRIFWAGGIQFTHDHFLKLIADDVADPALTDADRASRLALLRAQMFPEGLLDRIPGLFVIDDGITRQALHFNAEQNVLYTIESIEDKASFITALLTPNVIVLYAGHARFGRGPCFSPNETPSDDWENGTDPVTRGLFRMGFPFLSVPLHEFQEHGYHATLLSGDEPKPRAADSEPDLRRRLGQLVRRTVRQMHVDAAVVAKVAELFGVDPDSPETFWTFVALDRAEIGPEVHVVLIAHWKDTVSAPADLGSIEPLCRVFCHFGCSTFQHNHPPLRKFKKWVREGDERHAFFTTDVANNQGSVLFLKNLLTMPGRQSRKPWAPWLARGISLTNRDLRNAEGPFFQLI